MRGVRSREEKGALFIMTVGYGGVVWNFACCFFVCFGKQQFVNADENRMFLERSNIYSVYTEYSEYTEYSVCRFSCFFCSLYAESLQQVAFVCLSRNSPSRGAF